MAMAPEGRDLRSRPSKAPAKGERGHPWCGMVAVRSRLESGAGGCLHVHVASPLVHVSRSLPGRHGVNEEAICQLAHVTRCLAKPWASLGHTGFPCCSQSVPCPTGSLLIDSSPVLAGLPACMVLKVSPKKKSRSSCTVLLPILNN